MTNVFAGTPEWGLNVGDEVDDSRLYINQKGYLSIGENKKSSITPENVKMGFMENRLKIMDEKLDRLIKAGGLQTIAEKMEETRNMPAMVPNFDVPPSDIPW